MTDTDVLDSGEGGGMAAAGWYPVEDGKARYWDGAAWTDESVDCPKRGLLSFSDHEVAALAHIGQVLLGMMTLFGGCLVPLVVLVTRGRRSAFVRRAALASLIIWATGIVILIGVVWLLARDFLHSSFWFIVVPYIAWVLTAVVGAVKAGGGNDFLVRQTP